MVTDALHANDNERALALADSLEQTGDLSYIRANHFRATAMISMGRRDEAIALNRQAISHGLQDYRDLYSYQEAARMLTIFLMNNRDYEGVVQTAVPILNILDSVESGDPEARLQMHAMLGQCNMKLKQPEQAKTNFDIVYKGAKKWFAEDTIGRSAVVFEYYAGITNEYLEAKAFAEAKKWVERADSLLPKYRDYYVNYLGEERGNSLADVYSAMLKRHQALIAFELGDKAEAERLFAEYQKLPGAENLFNKIAAGDFLLKAQRYAEAADQFTSLDQFIQMNGGEIMLDNIEGYVKKLEANLGAGRKDTVLYVARQIVENFDSAYAREKDSEAAKLATIYDTQGKERQIAEQKAELMQQRIIGLIVAIVLLTVFFIVYTLVRRRAAKRMAEMRAEQERIESELKIARNIQMSMVPSQFPNYEGLDMYASMIPAREVGGDLYGYVLIGDKLYFAIGDVSGKGVPASLFMAQATRLFRTLATQGMMPAEICNRMNEALSGEDNRSGMFVTFFLGLVDLKTGHLSFCNCGHNPPVICGNTSHHSPLASNSFLDMLPNVPIGIFPEHEYEGEEIEDIRNCTFFLYTDGLNEAENRQQERFGDKHLLDILCNLHFDSARQVVDALKAEVEKHRNGAEPNDDLTMMCLRIQTV
ncbi:MAG: PP2C family protein-serine/threonine phosphatase [Prevotella sp.]|nr:PP2C family protein-serine/threonine phosphatase [Prevotella sp.]